MADLQLVWSEYGDPTGAPVIALHGGGKTRQHFQRIGSGGDLARRWICPDLRGHGDSADAGPPFTVAQLARDVLATVDCIGIDDFDVVGHSLGGRVTAEICRQAPDRVRSAILLDPVVMTGEQYRKLHERPSQLRFEQWLERDFSAAEEMISELPTAHQGQYIPDDAWPHVRLEARSWLRATDIGRFRFKIDLPGLHAIIADCARNLPPQFGSYAGPTLLLVSGLWGICTEEGLTAVQSQLGAALSTVVIEGASHNLLWDGYPQTAAEVGAFLRRSAHAVSRP